MDSISPKQTTGTGKAEDARGEGEPKRLGFYLALLLLLIVGSAYAPTLTAIYEINDDHYLLWLANANRIHQQLPERSSVVSALNAEMFGRGRIAPAGILIHQLHARWLAKHPLMHRCYMLLMALSTALLLYAAGQRLTGSNLSGFLFSLWLMVCPAANDVWPHIVRGETIGMLQFATILWCITSGKMRVLSHVIFILLCFEKENFFLLAPALAWLEWTRSTTIDSRKISQRSAIVYLLTGLTAGSLIFCGVLVAGQSSHGGQSLSLSAASIMKVLLGDDGILERSLANSFWFIPCISAVLFWIRRRHPISDRSRKQIVFAALVVVPQVAIYLTRSSFEERYAFPLLVGTVLVNVLAIQYLANSVPARAVRMAGLLFLSLWLGRCWQIQFLESLNFKTETQALHSMVQNIVQRVSPNGSILVVSSRKSEHAAALLTFIGIAGRPDCTAFLLQPAGTDGYAAYGFDGQQDPTFEQLSKVEAVVWTPGMNGAFPPGLEPEDFENSGVVFEKIYLSLRQMKLDRVPQEYHTSFRK